MNFNKIRRNILLGLVSLVVVLSCIKSGVYAEDGSEILYDNEIKITDYRTKIDDKYKVPTKSGYVFGGWYGDADGKEPLTAVEADSAKDGEAYAKWVPDYVLSVKAQVNGAALDDSITNTNRAAMRILTSVDSRDYEEVGFDITRGDINYTYHLPSANVSEQVRYVGETDGEYMTLSPEEAFGNDSHFFEAVTFGNMPKSAVNTELKATPYWKTKDGTIVTGVYSIKTVNLGRSWVYIGDTPNSDGTEFGTYDHPFTKAEAGAESAMDSALNSVLLQSGKITVKAGSTVNVPKDFNWEQRGKDITITGESGTSESLDFSKIQYLVLGDSVTFSNMTLKLYGYTGAEYAGKVFANGNRLTIAETVTCNSEKTYMFGGGYYSTSVQETDITILGGNYYYVYGGANGSATDKKGVVTGNTHVTFGGTAKATYVCGGGASNSDVKGTCNVEVVGGSISEGIYGGGTGSTGKNAHTSVFMSGGTAQQIFGGNQSGMTGNVYVEISGGTVTRRVYGGCYNELSESTGEWKNNTYVDGCITVVIKGDAEPKCNKLLESDRGILASSRRETKAENETGILIFNDDLYDTYGNKVGSDSSVLNGISPYDYLVKTTSGGEVVTRTDLIENEAVLSISPSDAEVAGTIKDVDNNKITYFKGTGACTLSTTGNIVEVDFNSSDAQSGLETCEARVEGIYYSTLEEAVSAAIVRKDTPFVTLMGDAGVTTSFEITNGQTLKVQSESEENWKTVIGNNNDLFIVRKGGNLVINNLNLTSGKHALYLQGTLDADNIYIHDITGVGIYVAQNGVAYGDNIEIKNAGNFGIFVMSNGQATLDDITINNVATQYSDRYAIKCQDSGQLKITANNDAKNGVTITGMTSGGGITNASSSKIEAVGVNIEGTSIYPIHIESGKEIEITDLNITRASGNSKELIHIASGATFTLRGTDESKKVDGNSDESDSYVGRGVVVNGTFNLYGGNITNNKITSDRGAGVLVNAGGTFNMYGGSVSYNTAPSGGGVSLEGTAATEATDDTEATEAKLATLNLEGGNISYNTVTGEGGGVYVTNGKLYMPEISTGSISYNKGQKDGAGVYLVAGATFDMYNGSIANNELHTSNARGGGVCIYASSARFTLYGGNISENIARAGGGVIIRYGDFVMNGGKISGNQANNVGSGAGQGGAVYVLNSKSTSVFTMNGGDITGNTAQDQGTAVFNNGGTFKWNGGTFTNYTGTNTITGAGSSILEIKTSIYETNIGLINTTKIKTITQIN